MVKHRVLVIGALLALSFAPTALAVYQIGDTVSDFCLDDIDGPPQTCLYDFVGDVVLITFWDYMCTTCREEAEWIENNLWTVYQGQGFTALSIGAGEDLTTCQAWASETRITYPVLSDPPNVVYPEFGQLGIYPHTAVLDRSMVVHYNDQAFAPTRLLEVVQDLLSTPGPGETPTPTPTQQPTATPTGGSPTPTPTGGADALQVGIWTSQQVYHQGDLFRLQTSIQNSGRERSVDRYIILDVYQEYYFWPGWTQDLDSNAEVYPDPHDIDETILEFTWPAGAGSASGILFWHACLTAGTTDLASNVASTSWGFE